MSSVIAAVGTAVISSVASIHRFIHERCKRGAETIDQHPERDIAVSQPKKKRRKVQTSLCVNSKYINRITDWLASDDITTIGIHGMGGVGKTTLAMHIYNQLQNDDISHINLSAIGWVSVALEFTVYQLQKQIAAAFGIDLEGDKDEVRRAAMLYSFLSRTKKKFTLFLDNLWSDFRCEDVGIPRNCKLIVVTRLLDVCRSLGCQQIIKVEPLSKEESWELFHCKIGEYSVLDSIEVSSLKKLVYDKSAGLPLAITMLAKSMPGMADADSEGTELSFGPTQTEYIFSRLKLSYDKLNNIKLQHCFLQCASYPKGYAINKEELIHSWFNKRDNVPLSEAQLDRGHSILNMFINSCLLETCEDTNSVKMHDLVRHMALSIATDCSKARADIHDAIKSSST